jgi:hypothetical protein
MREREGGKQSSHQHKSSNSSMKITPSLKTERERELMTSISITAVVMGEKRHE